MGFFFQIMDGCFKSVIRGWNIRQKRLFRMVCIKDAANKYMTHILFLFLQPIRC